MTTCVGRRSALAFGVAAVLWLGPSTVRAQDEIPNPKPDKDLKPTFGSVKLKAGFLPDPFRKDLIAGGELRSKLRDVTAWVARAPDFELNYEAGEKFPLMIYADSSADTTLLVLTPDGKWFADDDSGGNLNPLLKFPKPGSGRYLIWVGTYGRDLAPARLYVTERDLPVRDTAAPSRGALKSVSAEQLGKMLTDLKIPNRRDAKGIRLNPDAKAGEDEITVNSILKGRALVIGVTLAEATATLEQVNRWNDEFGVFSRAVLKSGRPRLESDLDCEEGVTPERLLRFRNRFDQSLEAFRRFLQKSSKGGPAPAK